MENKEHALSDKAIRILTYSGLAPLAALFVLAFSLWTSPLYDHWYGCDASFFTLVGRGMLSGMVPYRDFYDLKGPYFFFIQALGQFIGRGHLGIYILQVIALYASLVLIYKLARLYISQGKALGVIVFFLLPYISLMWGGNCLEEFALPLNLFAIWLNVRAFLVPENKVPASACGTADADRDHDSYADRDYDSGADQGHDSVEEKDERRKKTRRMYMTAVITGLCFIIMTFSKVTAGAPLIGMCIGIFVLMMIRRHGREFGLYVLYFLTGACIGLVPLLVYFGCHGCILKMLYCTFVFAFKRSSDLSKIFSWGLERKVSGATFSLIFALLHIFGKRKKAYASIRDECILLLPMSLVTYLVLHLGDGFIYYFITGMPCLVFALVLFAKVYDPLILFKNVRQSICWLLIFVFVYQYTEPSVNSFKAFLNRPDEEFQQNYYRNSMDMGSLIPVFDRDSVFSFDIDMQWYEINGILPCNRYVVNLQYFIALEPGIEQELFDFFEQTPPKWMICSNTLPDYLPRMDEMVRSKYDCIYTTDVGIVYLLKK